MRKYKLKHKAFTLVELIVVITILAVLATVAFISFQWYVSTSRDSVRLSDMANIEKWLNMKTSIAQKLPYPDDNLQVTASWVLLNYQGYAWSSVLGEIEVHGGGIDPLDKKYYTYSVNERRNKYQILWFLESDESTLNVVSTPNNERFIDTKWSKLWIIFKDASFTQLDDNLSEVDIINTNNDFVALLSHEEGEIISWTGQQLTSMLPNADCKRINDVGDAKWDGLYTINPSWKNEIQVYCNMSIDWWGWTQLKKWSYNDWEIFAMNITDSQKLNADEIMQTYTRTWSVILDINKDWDYLDPEDIVNTSWKKYGYIIKDFSSNRAGCSNIESVNDIVSHLTGKKDFWTCLWGNTSWDYSQIKIDYLWTDDLSIWKWNIIEPWYSKDECLYNDTFEWNSIHGIDRDNDNFSFIFQYDTSNTLKLWSLTWESINFCNWISWNISHIDHHYTFNNPWYMDRNIRTWFWPYHYPYIQHLNTNHTFIR
jgi:prepilin-type N-terminal cleavage/methylation domain-containing protein